MKILDCTLRDGGYYTNWDFDPDLIRSYVEATNVLPIDYIEIGYRSNPMKEYLGEFFYCPTQVIETVRSMTKTKLAVMLNEKDVRPEHADTLLAPCKGLIEMIRIAVDPNQFHRAVVLAEKIKMMGFEVGFNVMYMSSWAKKCDFIPQLRNINGLADYLYMVDSYGGVYPKDVRDTYDLVRSHTDVKIGFHGHNNLELALINTLTALECGVEIVDATVTGMGRGAGNLKTELLLTSLNAKGKLEFDFNALSKMVDPFVKLRQQYDWGTNLPYMVSGANSLPQKEVMDWVSTRYYSFNSIIRALSNQSKGVRDNIQLPRLDFKSENGNKSVLIIGGGPSAVSHARALNEFLHRNPHIPVIHASSKNASCFQSISNVQYYCLVGNEGYRLEKVFNDIRKVSGKCVLPPFPRKMGTYIPNILLDRAYELESVEFTDQFTDSHTALALQSAIELGATEILVAGYDGYSGSNISQREQDLFFENEFLFSKIAARGIACKSLTATSYKAIGQMSVYSIIA